jgi:KaiC/GvpD/RAD55 family RecA-like ATPase
MVERYVRLQSTVASKGTLIKQSEFEDLAKLKLVLSKEPNLDWYTSVFSYGEEAKAYFEANGYSIKGYTGIGLANKLIFDFDSEENLGQARLDTIEILKRLKNEGIDVQASALIFWSGAKGFHVEVPIKSPLLNEELKDICTNLSKGLTTFDPVIYNITRLIRIVNTKHQVTGLYKIPFTPNEFIKLTIEQIKELAKQPKEVSYTLKVVEDTRFLNKYKIVTKPKFVLVNSPGDSMINGIKGLDAIDFHKCPKSLPRCIYALEKGVMVPGERNNVLLRLAAYYRNQGKEKELAYRTLKGVVELNARLYPNAKPINKDEIWNTVINSTYSAQKFSRPNNIGTKKDNDLLKKYCESINSPVGCSLHNDKLQATINVEQLSEKFSEFAKSLNQNTIKTGIKFLDSYVRFAPGTFSILAGAPGCSKTSIVLNILHNINRNKDHTLFFSLDMGQELLYFKMAKLVTNYSEIDILNAFESNNNLKNKILQTINNEFKYTEFDFNGSLNSEDLFNKFNEVEQNKGCKIKLSIIDYAQCLRGTGTDDYSSANKNALAAKDIAKRTNSAWLYVSQIARHMGTGQTPLRTKRVSKESSSWEDNASIILTMWRPFLGLDQQDDVLRLFIAKNRMGRELEQVLGWNGEKGKVWDLTDNDRKWYEENKAPHEKAVLTPNPTNRGK